MISFFIDAKLYKQERRTSFGHGLGHEEKKNTANDNFELHLDSELGNSRNVEVVLIGFFRSETGQFRADYSAKIAINPLSFHVYSDGNVYGAAACARKDHECRNIGT